MPNAAKTLKYGKIEVPISDGSSPHVPKNAGKFIDHGDILKTLAIAVKDNLSVLLIGESGTGKTSAIRHLASETQNGLRRVNLNGGTTADELVGRLQFNEKGTYWVDGILTEAMRKGEWIVLDEINAALPEVLFVLQPIMDDDGYLTLNEKDDKEIVHRHKDFRIFATCNPPEYAGTKEMNKALLSRFAICINSEFPPEDKELEIIESHLGNAIANTEMAKKIIALAAATRITKEQGNADYAINTRDILNTLRLTEMMEPIEALSLAFANKLDVADSKALKSLARLQLPSSKKKANATRKQINTTDELMIGKTYVMSGDVQNAYFAVSEDQAEFEELMKADLGTIIQNNNREGAVRGDEFVIEGTYYEQEDFITKAENSGLGKKIASAIKINAGPNKGKKGFMFHHEAVQGTEGIIEYINEIE